MNDIVTLIDELIAQAKAGDDTTAKRELLLASIGLAFERALTERHEVSTKLVDEYLSLARKAREGHA